MEWFRNLALKNVIGSLIRHGLNSLGSALVTKGLVEGADWEALVVYAAPLLAGLALSLLEKASTNKKIEKALDMPRGSTQADLAKEMA